MTTAQALSSYYRELTQGGVPHETAHELVLEAGHQLLGEGDLVVRTTATGELLRITTLPTDTSEVTP
ncbi:hypothetical protein ACMA1D_01965 [Streptomyces sp. 796.1]|uniref:hypothetical protein n=1 Tax=Streptomyces sp. 796.1 TaxID=3163029 RepID=UPI0039C9A140